METLHIRLIVWHPMVEFGHRTMIMVEKELRIMIQVQLILVKPTDPTKRWMSSQVLKAIRWLVFSRRANGSNTQLMLRKQETIK